MSKNIDWHENSNRLIEILSKSLSSEYKIDRKDEVFKDFVSDLTNAITEVCIKHSIEKY